jgi:cytochrome bd ubiquinol oxidase subunit II
MEYVVIAFLYLSLLLYLVLGGADFGAGIIEFFTSARNISKTRKKLYHTIGPIWEANHMWLIIAIVILFVGFPQLYSMLSVYLHLPLLLMLLGIIARGTAFVFRHYDAVQDEWQLVYNKIFVWSSIVTPLFLGILAGSVVSGHIDLHSKKFSDAYLWSWVNWFSLSVGFFTVALCGYLASVYLIGEADHDNDRIRFIRKAKGFTIAAMLCGVLVFGAAVLDGVPLHRWMFSDPIGMVAVLAATLSLFFQWITIHQQKVWLPRILAGFQVAMILLAISYAHFPDFIITANGVAFSLLEHQAPTATMNALGWVLILGSVFILPALFHLFYSFQRKASPA